MKGFFVNYVVLVINYPELTSTISTKLNKQFSYRLWVKIICPFRATLSLETGYPRRSACRRSFSGGAAIGLKLSGLSAQGLKITIEAPRSKLTRNLRFFYNYFFCVRLPRSKLTGNALTELELACYSSFATEWQLNSTQGSTLGRLYYRK